MKKEISMYKISTSNGNATRRSCRTINNCWWTRTMMKLTKRMKSRQIGGKKGVKQRLITLITTISKPCWRRWNERQRKEGTRSQEEAAIEKIHWTKALIWEIQISNITQTWIQKVMTKQSPTLDNWRTRMFRTSFHRKSNYKRLKLLDLSSRPMVVVEQSTKILSLAYSRQSVTQPRIAGFVLTSALNSFIVSSKTSMMKERESSLSKGFSNKLKCTIEPYLKGWTRNSKTDKRRCTLLGSSSSNKCVTKRRYKVSTKTSNRWT